MRHSTRRPHPPAGRPGSVVPLQGPFGPIADPSLSMTTFFGYLHDHESTTDLAKALADVAMLRTTGARPRRVPPHERMAS